MRSLTKHSIPKSIFIRLEQDDRQNEDLKMFQFGWLQPVLTTNDNLNEHSSSVLQDLFFGLLLLFFKREI